MKTEKINPQKLDKTMLKKEQKSKVDFDWDEIEDLEAQAGTILAVPKNMVDKQMSENVALNKGGVQSSRLIQERISKRKINKD